MQKYRTAVPPPDPDRECHEVALLDNANGYRCYTFPSTVAAGRFAASHQQPGRAVMVDGELFSVGAAPLSLTLTRLATDNGNRTGLDDFIDELGLADDVAALDNSARATPGYVQCPTDPRQSDGTPHTVIGCGATITDERDDEGLVDCPQCGIWFNADEESRG